MSSFDKFVITFLAGLSAFFLQKGDYHYALFLSLITIAMAVDLSVESIINKLFNKMTVTLLNVKKDKNDEPSTP